MKKNQFFSLPYFLIIILIFITSCTDDDDQQIINDPPTIENIEIGSGNSGKATIGRDFHFNAHITAGQKIDVVTVEIAPKNGVTYAKEWKKSIDWTEFKGQRNATVHKHFTIPDDAPEGTFDFIVTVKDENGTLKQEKVDIMLYKAENLPIDPKIALLLYRNQTDILYVGENYTNPEDKVYRKGDLFEGMIGVSRIKGDGEMVIFLIHKDHQHLPESIDQLDRSKAIIYGIHKHNNFIETQNLVNSHSNGMINSFRIGETLNDFNQPSDLIAADKSWKSGEYYLGVLYHNSTYQIHLYKYIDFKLDLE